MFKIFRKNKSDQKPDSIGEDTQVQEDKQEKPKQGFLSRLKNSLSKTRDGFTSRITSIFKGKSSIDDETLEELEAILIQSDMGIELAERLTDNLKKDKVAMQNPELAIDNLKKQLMEILNTSQAEMEVKSGDGPFVILMVGINGAGKTTSTAKLSKLFTGQGKSVLLAAGDTFRAAAIEQLQAWGDRENIPVISQHQGADSASVIFDAYNSAQSKGIDVLIADTAGRLHTQDHLMRELSKIAKVLKKINPNAPQETMLVLDAGTGQNAVKQVKTFNEVIGVSGLCITKLDGTAKGGAIFQIANEYNIPIRYIGIGESSDDLKPFNAKDFINALFNEHINDDVQEE